MRCKNAFLHQMHFCITFCFAKMHLMLPLHFVYKMLESGKMHFGVHFPKENVQRTFSKGKCSAYIWLWKMFSCAKMHLMRTFCYTNCYKCIWCVHFVTQNVTNAFDAKMHFCNATRTFYEVKCSASHFTLENVQHHIFQRKMFSTNKMYAPNVFLQGTAQKRGS